MFRRSISSEDYRIANLSFFLLDPLHEGLKEPSSENLQAPYYVDRKKISNDTFRKSFEVTLRSREKS